MNRKLIVVLLVLALASWWGRKYFFQSGTQHHALPALEFEMDGVQLLANDKNGQQQLQLQASRLWKNRNKSMLQVNQPILLLREDAAEKHTTNHDWNWKITAHHGSVANDNSWILLEDSVRLQQVGQEPPLLLMGEQFRYLPSQRRLSSQKPVVMQQAGMQIHAGAMTAELNHQIIDLQQQVTGQYQDE